MPCHESATKATVTNITSAHQAYTLVFRALAEWLSIMAYKSADFAKMSNALNALTLVIIIKKKQFVTSHFPFWWYIASKLIQSQGFFIYLCTFSSVDDGTADDSLAAAAAAPKKQLNRNQLVFLSNT